MGIIDLNKTTIDDYYKDKEGNRIISTKNPVKESGWGSAYEDKNTREAGDPYGVEDLVDDDNFGVIEKFMDQRHGMTQASGFSRKKITDAYINHMRKFTFGQSVTTLGELSYLNAAKKDNNTERLNTAASAYELFDNMKSGFSSGTSLIDKADVVKDYGRALIWDPVNLVSFGIGKLAAQGSFKAASLGIKKYAMQQAVDKLGEKATVEALKKEAFIQSRDIKRLVMKDLLKLEGIKSGSAIKKTAFNREMLGSFGAESVASGLIDAAYQTSERRVGRGKPQHDWLQTGTQLAFQAAAFGGIFSSLNYLSKKASKNGDNVGLTAQMLGQAEVNKANALVLAGIDITKANKKAIELINKDPQKVIDEFKTAKENQKSWAQRVMDGLDLAEGTERTTTDVEIFSAFIAGAKDGDVEVKGIYQILQDNGITVPPDRGGYINFTQWLLETTNVMPDLVKKEIDEIYSETLGKHTKLYSKATKFTGTGPEAGGNILAKEASEWGKFGHILSKMSRNLKDAMLVSDADPSEVAAKLHLDPGLSAKRFDTLVKGGSNLQKSFIKALVTHPATVGLNVMGWSSASVLQSSADIVRAGLYGGRGFYEQVLGDAASSKDWYKYSRLMVDLQRQKLTTLVDPSSSIEDLLDMMAYNPKLGKELFRYLNGGIEDETVLKSLTDIKVPITAKKQKEISKKFSTPEESRVNKLIDGFQTIYGVKAQDIITKSIEFMYNIDKQMRLNHKMTYKEFIADENLWVKLDDNVGKPGGWAEMQAAAIEDTLSAVYAKPYGRYTKDDTEINQVLGYAAKQVEEARGVLLVGALIPFGQFFNNTLGHMFDHTGISIAHKYFAGSSKSYMDLTTKAAVGVSTASVLGYSQVKNVEENLQWHEERLDDGTVRSRLYDFPYNFYKAIGYLGAYKHVNGEMSNALLTDIADTFGPAGLLRGVSDTGKETYTLMLDSFSNKNADVASHIQDMIGDGISLYASGLTRPLDPVNQVIGAFRGEDYTERDKNQGAKSLNYSIRYVDQIFEGLLAPFPSLVGQEVPEEKRRGITEERGRAPIGRLFGFRETPRQSSMQKMFNDVGKPQWRTNIKAYVPRANNALQKEISSIIEYSASRLINTNAWKTASLFDRESYITEMLTASKKTAEQNLKDSFDPKDERMGLMYDLTKRGGTISKKRLQQYMSDLEMDLPVEELTTPQIRMLFEHHQDEEAERKRNLVYISK